MGNRSKIKVLESATLPITNIWGTNMGTYKATNRKISGAGSGSKERYFGT